jgi:hypothetical protein
MKTKEEKLKIACEMVKNLVEENKKLKRKVANQRRQLKEFNRLEKEGQQAILAEETRIKLAARKQKKEKIISAATVVAA